MTSVPAFPALLAFRPGESIKKGFTRVLGQIANRAYGLTSKPDRDLAELVHDGRILIKRVRALLWFARRSFSPSDMAGFKTELRKAAKLLAAQRDLVVTQAILTGLSRGSSRSSERKALIRIADIQRVRQPPIAQPDLPLRQAMAVLRAAIKEMLRKAGAISSWPSSSERLKRAFRSTRLTGKKALRRGGPEQFHDWRKKAKRLLYQLQLVQALPGEHVERTISRVNLLQECLGDYHDSFVVRQSLKKGFPEVAARLVKRSIKILDKRMHSLRKSLRRTADRSNL